MRIIISPAKQMRVDTDSFTCTELPVFTDRAEFLKEWIRSLSYEEKKALWACNDKIARQNAERFAHMDLTKNLTPALLAYDGIQLSMYGGFEQVGPIGQSIVSDDQQTTTQAGDIVLYSGD